MSCDFVNNDLSNVRTSSENCEITCNNTLGCTHYTWTTWNGGTCWMKKGIIYMDDAFSTTDSTMFCGVMIDKNNTHIPSNLTTSFDNNILSNKSRLISISIIILILQLIFYLFAIFSIFE